MAGPLQNLILNIKANPSNAIQGFNKVEHQAKKMGRSVREEVSNPLGDAFKQIAGNVRSFVFGLIAVEKAIETIKRLVDRGRSTREIASKFRISTSKAALINRTSNVTGLSSDEIAEKIGLEEKPLSSNEVRALLTAVAKQNPFSVASEANLARGTLSADKAGRRAFEAAARDTLSAGGRSLVPGTTNSSAFGQINNMGVFRKQGPSRIPENVARDANALAIQKEVGDMLSELKEIKEHTADTARASKQEVRF